MKKLIYVLSLVICLQNLVAQGVWVTRTAAPNIADVQVTFSIGNSAYVYTGAATNNFYEYNATTNTWILRANFPGISRTGAAGFSVDSFGYVGSGYNATYLQDFYQYDPDLDTWTSKSAYPDSVRYAFCFSLGGLGYIASGQRWGGGDPGTYAYDPNTDQWIVKDSIPFAMSSGFSAVVNGKAYCGLGFSGSQDSVFEYDPVADDWTSKAGFNVPPNGNQYVYSFVSNGKIYLPIRTAINNNQGGLYEFDPAANTWSVVNSYPTSPNFPCTTLNPTAAFSIAGIGYLKGSQACNSNNFWEYDPTHSFQITSVSKDSLCEYDMVDVSFTSNIAFNSGNEFKLRLHNVPATQNNSFTALVAGTTPGTYTFQVPGTVISGSLAAEKLTIFSTSPVYNTTYYDSQLVVKRGPNYMNFAPEYYSCAGSAVMLYRSPSNVSAQSYSWTSDPWGLVSSAHFVSITPTQNTTVYVSAAYNATGCSLSDTIDLIYTALPNLNITDSFYSVCPGTTLNIGNTAIAGYSYAWTGSGLTSSLANPAVTPAADATYHVVVRDSTSGCISAGNTIVDLTEAPEQTICFVTVDSASTHNVIVWEKLDQMATDSFYLYREFTTNNYVKIAAIHRDSLSEYHDYAANPNVTGYRYKISTKDTCSNASALSPYHNSIHLQYLGSGNLIWNVYQIENSSNPVLSFDVYRDSLANGNWDLMVTVPGTQHTATDINFNQHPNAIYRIVANWAQTCTPSRSGANFVLSNVIQISPSSSANISAQTELSIYPNPANDYLMIKVGNQGIETVVVWSADGKMVHPRFNQATGKLDISDLSSGIYIAEIKAGVFVSRTRFVKQ